MSPLNSLKYLKDMHDLCLWIEEHASGKTYESYKADDVLQAAMERKLEIIGEALSQMLKMEPGLAPRIDDSKKIISFRNKLIHGYSDLNQEIIWDAVTGKVPALRLQVEALLKEKDSSFQALERP
jgi:uncharacterized protein with HEPN domain